MKSNLSMSLRLPGRILRVLQKLSSSPKIVTPVLVALGSIPRKYEDMSIIPELDLAISTGPNDAAEPLYYITVEVTRAAGIVPEIFVVERKDSALNTYSYTRVAGPRDLNGLGISPVTTNSEYRVSSFTLKTNSLSYIKDLREGVIKSCQDLTDRLAQSEEFGSLGKTTTITITGGSDK